MLPVYELKISEKIDDESEVEFVSLVDAPAIQRDYLVFNEQFVEPSSGESKDDYISRCISYQIGEGKDQDQAAAICYSTWENKFQESYNDYPKQASENAKVALRWADENGWGECGTPVGKERANQLASGESLSRDTIARMAAFERHRQNSQKELGDGCGRLMWLAWGGDAGIEWAARKLQQIDREKQKFQIVSEDQRIISGLIMIAGEKIYRNNDQFGEHYVVFSAETIKKIAIKFSKKKYHSKVNLMHDKPVNGVTMFESFIVDKKRGIQPMAGFEDVADGSWFGSFYVENEEVWKGIKSGEYKGFSVEGLFDYAEEKPEMTNEEKLLQKISQLLSVTITED